MRPLELSGAAVLLASAGFMASHAAPPRARASSLAADRGIVMTGEDFVDLKWDPSQYQHPEEQFIRWELYRGLSWDSVSRISAAADQTTSFYRDSGLTRNTNYVYKLEIVRCPTPPCSTDQLRTYGVFSGSTSTTHLRGWLYQDLTLAPREHLVGDVHVAAGVTLHAGSGVTLTDPASTGQKYVSAEGGRLEVDGATIGERLYLCFGDVYSDNYDEDPSGQGYVKNAAIGKYVGISIRGSSLDIEVSGNTFTEPSYVYVAGKASAVVSGNLGGLHVDVVGAGSASVSDNNPLADGVTVSGDGQATVQGNLLQDGVYAFGPNGRATVTGNAFQVKNYWALRANGGGRIVASDNSMEEAVATWNSRLIQVGGGAEIVARRNTVVGSVRVDDGGKLTLTDSVLRRGGVRLNSGVLQGEIRGNTVENGTGFVVEDGADPSALTIRDNCIRGNNTGLVIAGQPVTTVDVSYNWWGDASGPKHPTNAGGVGDEIVGDAVVFKPFRTVATSCMASPPPPPQPAAADVALSASATRLMPSDTDPVTAGPDRSYLTATVVDDTGAPVSGVTVEFTRTPEHGSLCLAGAPCTCTTGSRGDCTVVYLAPTAVEAWNGTEAADEVVVTAKVGSLSDDVTIAFEYLGVVEVNPEQGARNVDWENLVVNVLFDRSVQRWVGSEGTFTLVTSWHDGALGLIPTWVNEAFSGEVDWKSDAKKLGLRLTGTLAGGPSGVRGSDGSMLRTSYTWQFATVPELSPRVIPVQVVEGADLLVNKPAVVRVHAGLDEDSELDWVQADVMVHFPGQSFSRDAHRFYPGEYGGSNAPHEVRKRGNSCVLSSARGEVPIIAPASGGTRHDVEAVLFLKDTGGRTTRTFRTTERVAVRKSKFNQDIAFATAYAVTPRYYSAGWSPPYPWQSGTAPAGFASLPVLFGGAHVALRLLPVQDVDFRIVPRIALTGSPVVIGPFRASDYLRRWARILDLRAATVGRRAADHVQILVVPKDWMKEANLNDPVYHGTTYCCLVGEDAAAAALAHCFGHRFGLADGAWGSPPSPTNPPAIKGYAVEYDEMVDNAHAAETGTGQYTPLMRRFLGTGTFSLAAWIDRDNYRALLDQLGGSVSSAVASGAGGTVGVTVGGEIIVEGSSVSGALDVVEVPRKGRPFTSPSGGGDVELRFLDGGGGELARLAFAPAFASLDGRQVASFMLSADVPDGVRQIELVYDDALLDSVVGSAHAPAVQVTHPAGGTASGTITASWTGSDGDAGDEVRYGVLLTSDNGETWEAVALETTGSSLEIDTTAYANGTNCRVKVIATDGFHATEGESPTFGIANPPRVSWVWPGDGTADAGTGTTVVAAFRDAMDAGTISASTLTLRDGGGAAVTGAVRYDVATRRASFTPAAALATTDLYTATVSGGVRDAGGQVLGSDFTWSFRVAASAAPPCPGDCDADGTVTATELLRVLGVRLGMVLPSACLAADPGGDGVVSATDVIRALNAARNGCAGGGTAPSPALSPTPSPTPSPTASSTPGPAGILSQVTEANAVAAGAALDLRHWDGTAQGQGRIQPAVSECGIGLTIRRRGAGGRAERPSGDRGPPSERRGGAAAGP